MSLSIDDSLHEVRWQLFPMNIITMEECAELQQVISKLERYPENEAQYHDNLVEEIADVLLCIEVMRDKYGVSEGEIQDVIQVKEQRARELIKIRKQQLKHRK